MNTKTLLEAIGSATDEHKRQESLTKLARERRAAAIVKSAGIDDPIRVCIEAVPWDADIVDVVIEVPGFRPRPFAFAGGGESGMLVLRIYNDTACVANTPNVPEEHSANFFDIAHKIDREGRWTPEDQPLEDIDQRATEMLIKFLTRPGLFVRTNGTKDSNDGQ